MSFKVVIFSKECDFIMKKKKCFLISTSFMLIVLVTQSVLLFRPQTVAYTEYKKHISTFGDINYQTINHKATGKEINQSVMPFKKVEEALNYCGSKNDCYIGTPLEALCKFNDDNEYTNIDSKITFITFNIKQNTGYLWFTYNRVLKNNEEIISQENNVLCLVIFERHNTKWTAIEIVK